MTPQDDLSEKDDAEEEQALLNISIILLAAGSSSRMGKSKQLLDINGEPLLLHAIKTALDTKASDVIVVLGANEQNHLDAISLMPIRTISNHFWKSGMGSSIKTGLHYLIKEIPESKGVIIMVCDQPALTAGHLKQLIDTFLQTRKPIVASYYSDTSGVPVLFARSFFSNILMLRDEHGAKKIIEQFPDQVVTVPFPEGAVDLDTIEDYENYTAQNKKVTG